MVACCRLVAMEYKMLIKCSSRVRVYGARSRVNCRVWVMFGKLAWEGRMVWFMRRLIR